MQKIPGVQPRHSVLSRATVVAGSSRLTLPCLIRLMSGCGKASTSTFRPEAQSSARTNPRSYASKSGAFDCLMELKSAAPKHFVAEGVEAECVSAVRQKLIRIGDDLRVEVSEFPFGGVTLSWWPSDRAPLIFPRGFVKSPTRESARTARNVITKYRFLVRRLPAFSIVRRLLVQPLHTSSLSKTVRRQKKWQREARLCTEAQVSATFRRTSSKSFRPPCQATGAIC